MPYDDVFVAILPAFKWKTLFKTTYLQIISLIIKTSALSMFLRYRSAITPL